jgi:hypothetical protein
MAKKVEAEAVKSVDHEIKIPAEIFDPERSHKKLLAMLTRPLDPWQVYEQHVQDPVRGPFHMHYTSSHDVRNRLDEVLGPQNWRAHYQSDPQGVRCILQIRANLLLSSISVMNCPGADEGWLEKTGTIAYNSKNPYMTESTDKEAFKHAALEWGIGRELYRKGTVCHVPPQPSDVLARVEMLLPDHQWNWKQKTTDGRRELSTAEQENPFSVPDAIAFIKLVANGENVDYLTCFQRPGWIEWVVAQYAKDRSIQVWKTLKRLEPITDEQDSTSDVSNY